MKEYVLVSYSLDIERNPKGNSKLVNELMGKLEAICKKHDGLPFKEGLAEDGHEDVTPTAENGFKEPPKTNEYARNRTRYLVGAAWVENCVDLFNGHMGTFVRYVSGQDDYSLKSEQDVAALLRDFDEFYKEGEKHESSIKVPDDEGKKF